MRIFTTKYQNLWYALVTFFYLDLFVLTLSFVSREIVLDYQIKQDVEELFNTPDLGGRVKE